MERGRCDDGNTESGDGCSSDCKIEYGFFCVNTSILSGSICNYVGLLPAITLD